MTNAHFVSTVVLGVMFLVTGVGAQNQVATKPARANLAIVAEATTSFVSGHETLAALNDGHEPRRSDDKGNGAYGNWPWRGTQWVEYEWAKAVSVNAAEVYWFDDRRGVRVPAAARLKYWDGNDWADVKATAPLGVERDRFNAITFDAVSTTRLRLEMDGDGESSTGILEWRVFDSGTSPQFPPLLNAGQDRIVVVGASTHLKGRVRSTGKPGESQNVRWTKLSGPGEVTFADPAALATTATFTTPGLYEVALQARAGEMTASSKVRVRVEPNRPPANISAVDVTRYTLDSRFWTPRIKGLIVNWIPHCVRQLEKPDLREGGIQNLVQAANKLAGRPAQPHVGAPWANAYILNTIESMCLAQLVDPAGDAAIATAQQAMRSKLDEWIPLLLAAQEPDGYFQTRITLGTPRERSQTVPRWDERLRREHEGYVAGYFIEAGIAHHLSTGGKDRRLYDAARRLADCWSRNIGPAPKKPWFDGHEGIELALFRLARYVDQVEGHGAGQPYADLAKFLLDCRGTAGHSDGAYDQSHVPVTQQYSVVGHAVRAVYAYTAMSDVVKATGDVDYRSAVLSLDDNLVNRKYYVTGGIGSGETSEGFGGDYSLPNNAYCESCSSVGLLFFQQRNQLLSGHAKHADLYEETLYNAILSDVDLKGENFTYTNSLDTAESRYKWHDCPCCVGNIPRALLSLPTWTYATSPDGLYVNLFVGGTMNAGTVGGTRLAVTQSTNYPWDGDVTIVLKPEREAPFKVYVRSPDRSVSEIYSSTPAADGILSLSVNDKPITPEIKDGYAVIERTWKPGDRINVRLPMAVQRVRAIPQVAADRGKVALRYGPLIYNIEAVDQKLDSILGPDESLTAKWMPDLLDGVVGIHGRFTDGSPLLAIPNYARNNRGGRSIVWIREQ